MPQETTEKTKTDAELEAEGQELIHQLQGIRDSLSDHARRHPKEVDFRAARAEVTQAIGIAVQAATKPHCGPAAETWLGYIVDDYERIVRADAAVVAQRIFG